MRKGRAGSAWREALGGRGSRKYPAEAFRGQLQFAENHHWATTGLDGSRETYVVPQPGCGAAAARIEEGSRGLLEAAVPRPDPRSSAQAEREDRLRPPGGSRSWRRRSHHPATHGDSRGTRGDLSVGTRPPPSRNTPARTGSS